MIKMVGVRKRKHLSENCAHSSKAKGSNPTPRTINLVEENNRNRDSPSPLFLPHVLSYQVYLVYLDQNGHKTLKTIAGLEARVDRAIL